MTSDGRPIDEATHGANASWVQGISLVGRWVASALATALLLALAEPPWDIWPLAGLALVPWLLRVGRSGSWIEALVGSLAVGVACAWASAPWGPEALRSLGAGPLTSIGST
jgi:hypothetical protein